MFGLSTSTQQKQSHLPIAPNFIHLTDFELVSSELLVSLKHLIEQKYLYLYL